MLVLEGKSRNRLVLQRSSRELYLLETSSKRESVFGRAVFCTRSVQHLPGERYLTSTSPSPSEEEFYAACISRMTSTLWEAAKQNSRTSRLG